MSRTTLLSIRLSPFHRLHVCRYFSITPNPSPTSVCRPPWILLPRTSADETNDLVRLHSIRDRTSRSVYLPLGLRYTSCLGSSSFHVVLLDRYYTPVLLNLTTGRTNLLPSIDDLHHQLPGVVQAPSDVEINIDPQSLAALIETAISTRSTHLGRTIHALSIKHLSPVVPSFLLNHLVNFYSKLDLTKSAATLLSLASSPSVVTWTALISGSVQNFHYTNALHQFLQMVRVGVRPNDFTFPCVFKASAAMKDVFLGRQIHGFCSKCGFDGDVYVACGVVDMYFKTGNKDDGRKMFDEMPVRNVVAWNVIMTNGVVEGWVEEVVEAFAEMRKIGEDPNSITICAVLNVCAGVEYVLVGSQVHGFVFRSGLSSDVRVGNGLIDFYGKCHLVELARRTFSEMVSRNDVSWCSMIVACAQNGEEEEAFRVFLATRREGWEPTDFMVSVILTTCWGLSGLDLGRSIHAVAVRSCIDANVFVGSSLVDMYGKCGSIEDAEMAFSDLPVKNMITWNSMIGGYAHQGQAELALATFQEMIREGEVVPNYVTILNVMTACSRGGFVHEGQKLFDTMKERFGIEPQLENYACVVDLLSRAGMFERAYEFIKKMPLRPSASVWGALLGACRMHGKIKLGRIAAEKLFELDPHDPGNHVLLSNMFASAGRWEEVIDVRKDMKQVGIKKRPGCSWITWKNVVHVFHAKDGSHDRNKEIQAKLLKLRKKMKAAGYTPDTNFALFDLQEEEKETELFHHSEKLALAFGLICIPAAIPIRITKNLRVCGDCHSAIKFISGIVGREIIVRDNNRFHRFNNNKCSCGDYW